MIETISGITGANVQAALHEIAAALVTAGLLAPISGSRSVSV